MKILSASDIHLDTFSSFALPVDNPVSNSRLENILQALEYFFETGAERDITTYIFNGDTFNNRNKMNPNFYFYCVKKVVDMFNKTPSGSTLYFNVGNHSEMGRFINPNSDQIFESFSTKSHTIIVTHREAELYTLQDNTGLLFVPYTEDIKKSKEAISKNLDEVTKHKKNTVVFAHLGVDKAVQGRWSHRLSGAYNLADLGWNRKYIKAIVLGHYHTRNMLYPSTNPVSNLYSNNTSDCSVIRRSTLECLKDAFKNGLIEADYEKGLIKNRKPSIDKNGYARIRLTDSSKTKHYMGVATVIGYLKFGDEIEGKVIDHINNKHGINDNYPGNLQLLTPYENLMKEARDNSKNIACKAKNYFNGAEVHAKSIYELSLRIKCAVSSIQKCVVQKACNVAGDFLVVAEDESYRTDITYNRFAVEGTNIKTEEKVVYDNIASAEEDFNIDRGKSHIGQVCQGIWKSWHGYTWKYIPHHPKAWYQGDLTELNFNDVNEDGTGAPRGFDIIDTETGESEFYDLSDKFPKFMIYDLNQDKIDIDELIDSMNKNYVKIVVHDKETYEQLTKTYQESEYYKPPYANIQLKVEPKQEQDLEIEATDSDADILKAYMKKYYPDPDLENLALNYLEKAQQ